MVSNSKVIYLQKEDGRSIKAYVLSYLKDKITDKNYVIVADQHGKNAKGYEVVGEQAVVLSVEESGIFKGYRKNPDFLDITSEFFDGTRLYLVKEAKKEETVDVVYYVYDNDMLNAYKAALSTSNVLSGIRFLKSWENIQEEDIARIVNENQYPEPAFVVYDKENDLEYGNDGTITPIKWTAVTDISYEGNPDVYDLSIEESPDISEIETDVIEKPEFSETTMDIDTSFEDSLEEFALENVSEPREDFIDFDVIVFYVYDQNVIKKYSAYLTSVTEDMIEVKDVKTIEVITGANNLNVTHFLANKEVELGSYFVNYDDYNPTIESVNGKLIAVATLKNFLQKTEEMENVPVVEEEKQETVLSEESQTRILMFNGDIDIYDNQTHYTIWGCFCTVLSENPFTVIPDKGGLKTIIYEDEKSSSIEEVCQNYQNLYPNVSVYLTKIEIKGNDPIVLEEYTRFEPQEGMKDKTLLESGKKILTEEEMIAKRQEELERLKNQAH
ncbi:MAG: hypothetical protein HFH08_03230 [Bacilli bacterium]|nr:hypothetical protein [Bacilli bacterium]